MVPAPRQQNVLRHYRGYAPPAAAAPRLAGYLAAAKAHSAVSGTMVHPEGRDYSGALIQVGAGRAPGPQAALELRALSFGAAHAAAAPLLERGAGSCTAHTRAARPFPAACRPAAPPTHPPAARLPPDCSRPGHPPAPPAGARRPSPHANLCPRHAARQAYERYANGTAKSQLAKEINTLKPKAAAAAT
jgi:hypothetical protein